MPQLDARRARRILIADDDATVREVVATYLERDGFEVIQVSDAASAREALVRRPDVLILDVLMPGMTGLELLRDLRRDSDVPVIMLTSRSDETDRVVGLELGADDYVVKPFSPRELVARVRSVLRRATPAARETVLRFDGLEIDTRARDVRAAGRLVSLRPMEFDLLAFLAASPRQVFSRGQLLERVWDSSPDYHDVSTVTVHVRRLRQRLEVDPLRPRWITTVWGVGYRFEP